MDDHKKKECPACVIEAGAALIVLRHLSKSPEDAAKVRMEHSKESFMKCHGDVWAKVQTAIDELASPKHGILGMRFGKGERLLELARLAANDGNMRLANCYVKEAHDAFEVVLSKAGVATPTNDQIAERIALRNWR